jgi:hypothetical protein
MKEKERDLFLIIIKRTEENHLLIRRVHPTFPDLSWDSLLGLSSLLAS